MCIELPMEATATTGECWWFNFKFYGCRLSTLSRENLYGDEFEADGFTHGAGSSVSIWHQTRDLACGAYANDLMFNVINQDARRNDNLNKGSVEIHLRANIIS